MKKLLWVLCLFLWTHEAAWPTEVCVLTWASPKDGDMLLPINLDHVLAFPNAKGGGTMLILNNGTQRLVRESFNQIDQWCLGHSTRRPPPTQLLQQPQQPVQQQRMQKNESNIGIVPGDGPD